MMANLMQAGWLTDLTNWFLAVLKAFWDAFVEFVGDWFVMWLKVQLEMLVVMLNQLPAPDFLSGSNLQTLFGSAGGAIGWWITVFQIDKCMAVVASASIFYIVRRIFTLGIW